MAAAARARKIAERVKAIVAEQLEYRVKGERPGCVTGTAVRVPGDQPHTTYVPQGRGCWSWCTPVGGVCAGAGPEGAVRLEAVLGASKARDEEIAKAASGAGDAGEADAYRKPGESDDDESEDDADDSEDDPEGAGDDADEPASERE